MDNFSTQYTAVQIMEENARFMGRVYRWMGGGLLTSAFVAYGVYSTPQVFNFLMMNPGLSIFLIIAQIALVFSLTGFIRKISGTTASILYFLYAILTGITFSALFAAYQATTIASAFFTTSFAFLGLSAFGYFTRKDLGPMGTFLTMGLWGLIGFSLLSFFFPSLMGPVSSKVYSLVGIVVFSGLTAYDTQKIKNMNIIGNEGTDEDRKEAIFGALTLYLDFINLFLFILRLMGGNDRR